MFDRFNLLCRFRSYDLLYTRLPGYLLSGSPSTFQLKEFQDHTQFISIFISFGRIRRETSGRQFSFQALDFIFRSIDHKYLTANLNHDFDYHYHIHNDERKNQNRIWDFGFFSPPLRRWTIFIFKYNSHFIRLFYLSDFVLTLSWIESTKRTVWSNAR